MMFVGCCPFYQKDNGRLAVYTRSARIILLVDKAHCGLAVNCPVIVVCYIISFTMCVYVSNTQ